MLARYHAKKLNEARRAYEEAEEALMRARYLRRYNATVIAKAAMRHARFMMTDCRRHMTIAEVKAR